MPRLSRRKTILALALLYPALTAVPAGAVSHGAALPIDQAPYVVSINSDCTGTLISPTRILTAGHCLDGQSASDAQVLVGADAHLLTSAQRAKLALPVTGFAVAPGFKESFPFSHKSPVNAIAINDVGLVLLKNPLTTVKPVRVAGAGDSALEAPGGAASIFGYGDTVPVVSTLGSNPAPVAPVGPTPLQQGPLTLISASACSAAFPNAIAASMLCSEDLTQQAPPFVQACAGDSGGPIVSATPSGPVQIGVTSWGPEVMNGACGQLHLPNVSMRVSSFVSFINRRSPVVEPYTVRPGHTELRRFAAGATVAGTVQVGHTVVCATPRLGGPKATLTYTWALVQDIGHVIARGHKLTLTSALYRKATFPRRIQCTATARNAGGSLVLNSGSRRLLQ